jgi:hypothetical protein
MMPNPAFERTAARALRLLDDVIVVASSGMEHGAVWRLDHTPAADDVRLEG